MNGKVLITGGAGYIGSHLCVELLEAGYDIVVVDNFENSKPQALDNVRKIAGKDFLSYTMDVRDRNTLTRVMSENQIDTVVHMAGLKAIGESVENPLLYYHNNLVSTLVLCEVMEKFGVKKFIFSSSASIYGLAEKMPVTEETPLSTINPYSETKRMIERILTDWQIANPDISVINLRYFNPVGGHASGLLGEDPEGAPANLVPYLVRVISGVYPKLRIFGDDYNTPDGTGVRDYIHISDLCTGHIKAIEYARAHKGTHNFNLGTGRGASVLEVLHTFEGIVGHEIPHEVCARRSGDADESFADVRLAKKELGFEAKKTLKEMCASSLLFKGY